LVYCLVRHSVSLLWSCLTFGPCRYAVWPQPFSNARTPPSSTALSGADHVGTRSLGIERFGQEKSPWPHPPKRQDRHSFHYLCSFHVCNIAFSLLLILIYDMPRIFAGSVFTLQSNNLVDNVRVGIGSDILVTSFASNPELALDEDKMRAFLNASIIAHKDKPVVLDYSCTLFRPRLDSPS